MSVLLRRIHEDLGTPPMPSREEVVAFLVLLAVGFAMTFVGPA